MKHHIFSLFVYIICLPISALAATDQCLTCHELFADKESSLFKKDIHHTKGISCAGCHGGNDQSDDMEKAMDKNAGFIGVPKGDDISARCASCHSDSLRMRKYGSSLPTNPLCSAKVDSS